MTSPDPGRPAPIAEGPIAGPALAISGALILLLIGLLAYSSSNPFFAPSVAAGTRAALFVLVGPGLGPLVIALAAASARWPRYRAPLGTAIIPLALLGIFIGAAGGLLLGPALGVVGGVLIVLFEPKTFDAIEADDLGPIGAFRRRYALIPVAFLVLGLLLAVVAPTAVNVGCPVSNPCLPTGPCPAVGTSCNGPTLWVVFVLSAIVTTPVAFRLQYQRSTTPIPA